jgi:hypothetical protein
MNSEQHKRRILDVVNNLNEEELEKVSEMLKVSEAMDKNDPNVLLADDVDRDGEVCFEDNNA